MLAARAVVDLMPCLFLCLCPSMVGISFGKYFDTNDVVKPGNVAKLPLAMAFNHVLMTG